MKRLLAALLALTSPAVAGQTIWNTTGNWAITGDVATKVCIASTQYVETGQQLLIAEYPEGWSLSLTGTATVKGGTYLGEIVTRTTSEALQGRGLGGGLVIFRLGYGATVRGLLTTDTVELRGIGVFRTDGVLAAMAMTHACFEDITGKAT